MPADALSLSWATSLNASDLLRETLTAQMAYHDIDRQNLAMLVDEAFRNDEYDVDDLIELTSELEDLKLLLEAPNPDIHQHE